jgi:CRISPR-associated protein Csb1
MVYGMWDSTGLDGRGGTKFARTIVSEIVGIDVVVGCKTSSRIDPLQIPKNAGMLYKTKDKITDGSWTLDPTKAEKDKNGKPIKLGKEGKPSEANHGNILPTLNDKNGNPWNGGVTLAQARQTIVLSLPTLRKLRFPVTGKKGLEQEETNNAARTTLAALGLCGAVLAQARGLDLRSRCLLIATKSPHWECLGSPGTDPETYTLTAKEATGLLNRAVAAAVAAGLPWETEKLILQPTADVVALVKKGRELASASGSEDS